MPVPQANCCNGVRVSVSLVVLVHAPLASPLHTQPHNHDVLFIVPLTDVADTAIINIWSCMYKGNEKRLQ